MNESQWAHLTNAGHFGNHGEITLAITLVIPRPGATSEPWRSFPAQVSLFSVSVWRMTLATRALDCTYRNHSITALLKSQE